MFSFTTSMLTRCFNYSEFLSQGYVVSWKITSEYPKLSRVHHEKPWGGGSTSWNQYCQEKYQPQFMQMTPPL